MHIRPSAEKAAELKDLSDRATAAVKAFRSMQYGLTGYAQALTGNKKIRVEVATGAPRTDGHVIYYQPPIALGDRTPHDRFQCSKRREDGLQACAACRVREEVLVNIYHEISHIVEETFAVTSDRAKAEALQLAIKEWGGSFEQQIRARMREEGITNSYLGLANLISPYLPSIVNCIEDARVDSAMFRRRKGTKKMMVADTFNMLKNGIPNYTGKLQLWADAPLNSQISLGVYMEAAGYNGWQEYFDPRVGQTLADQTMQDLVGQIRGAETAEQTYELAFPVLARLRELGYFKMPEDDPQPEENQEQQDDGSDTYDGDPADGQDGDDGGDPGESGDAASEGAESDEGSPAGSDDQGGTPPGESGAGAGEPPASQGDPSEGGAGQDEEGSGSSGPGSPDEGNRGDGSEPAPRQDDGGSDGVAEADAPSSDPSADVQGPSEEEAVDADSDGVPEESGQDGRGETSGGDAQPSDGPGVPGEESDGEGGREDGGPESSSEGDEGAADEADADADSRGDLDAQGDLGQDHGDDSGERDDSQDGGQSDQPDDDGGEAPADQRSPGGDEEGSLQDPSSPGEQDEPSRNDSDSGDSSAEGSDREVSEAGDGPSGELIDTGADQGLGGIDLTAAELGTPDDVKAATEHLHNKLEAQGDDNKGTMDERQAVQSVILQGTYFETPSTGVSDVIEHRFRFGELGWSENPGDLGRNEQIRLAELGIICDMDIPESALGPALLKTRRAFDDNETAGYENNMRRGRVNTKVLGRRAWSGDDRLFGKKRLPERKDYAVKIMVDISTSNWGVNLALVKRAVLAQAELLHRVGIQFSITAHSANGAGGTFHLHLHHIKDWDQPWDEDAKDAIRYLSANGGNVDGHAMEYGRRELGKVEATDKILLYYTDGKFPAANKEEELEVLLRQIQLSKRERITLLGVGIRTDSPIRHGLDTVQVDGDEDLRRVVEHLGKRLHRSAR